MNLLFETLPINLRCVILCWLVLLLLAGFYPLASAVNFSVGGRKIALRGTMTVLETILLILLARKSCGLGTIEFPWPALLLLLLLLTALTALLLRAALQWSRRHITPESLRESVNCLPTGLCYCTAQGMPLLVNPVLQRLSFTLTGEYLLNGTLFWNLLREGELREGCVRLHGGDHPIVQQEGCIFSFSRRSVTVDGRHLYELIAVDITDRYALSRSLEEDNLRLQDMRRRMQEFNREVEQTTREQEVLEAKIHLHDELGRCLLSARHTLLIEDTPENRFELLKLWRQNTSLLRQRESAGSSALDELKEAAEAIGVSILYRGALPPVGSEAEQLLAAAVHECLTNTVRHADGTELYAELSGGAVFTHAVLTNNGLPPAGEITEGGGLGNLRRMVERAGGRMRIQSLPEFRLELELPAGSRKGALPYVG